MNRSTQLMQLFNVDVTEMIFEFEAEVNLRYGKLMVKMHCGSTGHWESDRRRREFSIHHFIPIFRNVFAR